MRHVNALLFLIVVGIAFDQRDLNQDLLDSTALVSMGFSISAGPYYEPNGFQLAAGPLYEPGGYRLA